MYTLKNIDFCRGGFRLSVKSWSVNIGSICAITGPNGCGKSSLLKLLAFLEKPDSGSVYFNGSNSVPLNNKAMGVARQRIACQLQNPFLFNMTVRANLALGLKGRGLSRLEVQQRVGTILTRLGLSELADRTPGSLSGGEVQRVAVARALVLPADIYLLDEPTANVDKKNRELIEAQMTALSSEGGKTVIFTSHENYHAGRVTDNIIPMFEGKLILKKENT